MSPVLTPEVTPWTLGMGRPEKPVLRFSCALPTPLPLHHLGSLYSDISTASGLVSATSIPKKPRASKLAGP